MTLFDDIQNEIDAGIEDIGFPTEGYHHIMKASEMIDELQERYMPPVEMTKNDRDILLHNLENYPFDVFIVSISMSDKEIFGLTANKEFKGLSIEDLMQAWLHPETIKIVDE